MEKINLPVQAKIVIDTLTKSGFKAYIVGGIVRDSLLGKQAHDIDITTNARPFEVIKLFRDNYTIALTGIKYKTVTVIIDKNPMEITTFRSESGYEDGRRPDRVVYETKLENDLKRRDFTVNAMAYNDKENLVDLFGGIDDLENKIIRTVGDPDQRFFEDRLRMLRAVRFCSQLGFTLEENTKHAIKKDAKLIKSVSVERIAQEINKTMLQSDKPSIAFELMHETGLLKHILPDIDKMYDFDQQNPYHSKDLFHHTMEVVDNSEKDVTLRLSALFHDTGKIYTKTVDENGVGHFYGHYEKSAEIAKIALKKLKYSNEIIKTVSLLCLKHMVQPEQITQKGIRKLIATIGEDKIDLLVKLQKADSKSTTIGESSIFGDKVKQVLSQEHAFRQNDLALNGNDLIEMGYKGKKIGEIKKYLFEKVLDEPKLNQREELIKIVKENY